MITKTSYSHTPLRQPQVGVMSITGLPTTAPDMFTQQRVADDGPVHYSMGFMFAPAAPAPGLVKPPPLATQPLEVLLIMKPDADDWQHGRLNGVGGRLQNGESPIEAMIREFHEETGVDTTLDDWLPVCRLEKEGEWTLWVFTSVMLKVFEGYTSDEGVVAQHPADLAFLHTMHEVLDPTAAWLLLASLDIIQTGARIDAC